MALEMMKQSQPVILFLVGTSQSGRNPWIEVKVQTFKSGISLSALAFWLSFHCFIHYIRLGFLVFSSITCTTVQMPHEGKPRSSNHADTRFHHH